MDRIRCSCVFWIFNGDIFRQNIYGGQKGDWMKKEKIYECSMCGTPTHQKKAVCKRCRNHVKEIDEDPHTWVAYQ
jgi:uncharacterized paraquat-inducible protein A